MKPRPRFGVGDQIRRDREPESGQQRRAVAETGAQDKKQHHAAQHPRYRRRHPEHAGDELGIAISTR
jgi:hypothetical protein